MYGFGPGGWGFGGIGMILFWVLLVIAVVALFRTSRGKGCEHRTKTSLEILDERYAKGEIDREEYLKRRADLNH